MKICITGLIGSGKSSVLNILRKYVGNIYSCDALNDELLKDSDYLKCLQANFGENIVKNGVLDRKELAKIIFSDESKRKLLNKLSHPEITKRLTEIVETAKGNIFIEIPLLVESNLAPKFDKIWLVECESDSRVARIMKRDNITKELALAKINAQTKNEAALKKVATDTIYNDGNIDFLEFQIIELLQEING